METPFFSQADFDSQFDEPTSDGDYTDYERGLQEIEQLEANQRKLDEAVTWQE